MTSSFVAQMTAALARIQAAQDPDEREEAEAAMAQIIRSADPRHRSRADWSDSRAKAARNDA